MTMMGGIFSNITNKGANQIAIMSGIVSSNPAIDADKMLSITPIIAIRKSFFACLKNIIPIQIYFIVLIILGVLAIIPYGLGLFIYIPTVFASIYVSYQDIFHPESMLSDKEAIEKKEEDTEVNQ